MDRRNYEVGFSILITMFVLSAAVAGPIHDAAKNSNIDQVTQLIATGTNVDERDEAGHTPLELAAGTGRTAMIQLLITERRLEAASERPIGRPRAIKRTAQWYSHILVFLV